MSGSVAPGDHDAAAAHSASSDVAGADTASADTAGAIHLDQHRRSVVRVAFNDCPAHAPQAPASRNYDAVVATGALLCLRDHLPALCPSASRALLIVDAGVPDTIVGRTVGTLAAAGVTSLLHTVSLSEQSKSLESAERLLARAAHERLERDEPIIAIGGGIVGDVAGFVAATYRRGVPLIQCPTTLLAMVDASVGGKAAVNLFLKHEAPTADRPPTLLKNMVGAFWQPRLVICDIDSLASLPPRVFRAGLAECLKHALIGAEFHEPHLLDWMIDRAADIQHLDQASLCELVSRNIAIKARVVANDERELQSSSNRGRAALNAGHTFAHAFESAPNIDLSHGEAVALGLLGEVIAAEHAGVIAQTLSNQIRRRVSALGLPTSLPPGMNIHSLVSTMHDDKKTSRGKIRLMVPTPHRRVLILNDPPAESLAHALTELGASR